MGVHVRTVFDVQRASSSPESKGSKREKRSALLPSTEAIDHATAEYGRSGVATLMAWRRAAHWQNFVSQISSVLERTDNQTKFYLAADSEEAYGGLQHAFPHHIRMTSRRCEADRCDQRDCGALAYALIDLLNLARTRVIIGSGYTTYGEVAAWMGGSNGRSLPMLIAGRDFGKNRETL